jgi:hypothetical protein
MSLLDALTQQLGGQNLSALSNQLGLDENQTSSAVSAALPMLIQAMNRNTSSNDGAASLANALDKDHDGGILDNLGGFFASPDNGAGAGILKHLLGQNRGQVEQGISQMAGIDSQKAGGLLENLAPVLMGFLGQQKRQQGLDIGGIASLIGGFTGQAQQGGGNSSAAMSLLNGILDQDGDGSIVDDIGGGLLKNLFGGRKKRR